MGKCSDKSFYGQPETLIIKGVTIKIVSLEITDSTTKIICESDPICCSCKEYLVKPNKFGELWCTEINDNTYCPKCKDKAIENQKENKYCVTDFY
jgi:hypothetical protein